MTWNCNGGVQTSVTDPNNQVTSYSYAVSGVADPFWRVLLVTDPLSNATNFSYSPTTAETSVLFNNGNSIIDNLTTTDGLGRIKLQQHRQAPGSTSFDTVQYKYDAIGRRISVSMPCSAAAGAGCSTAVTSTTYDALNRAIQTTDGGGGTVTMAYNIKDMLQTIGPAPAGEHTKSRQYEYDGMGRTTSVCEILTSGGASCGQATTASGYQTSYTYTVPTTGGSQLVVTQGTQTRTYVFDALGRLTSETNPETNNSATTYIYDSLAANYCVPNSPAYNSLGDLVGTADPNGNRVCYRYDALHI
jgi:YD repeat-containing protein